MSPCFILCLIAVNSVLFYANDKLHVCVCLLPTLRVSIRNCSYSQTALTMRVVFTRPQLLQNVVFDYCIYKAN